MLRNYLKIAVKVLLRRKFYTVVSLFGIAFTLLVLVLCTAFLDEMFWSAYPETRRGRTLGIYRAKLVGPRGSIHSDAGYALLDRYARDLPGVERFSIISTPRHVASFVEGDKVESTLRRTDAAFWEIMEFDFVEGGPFTDQDETLGNLVAVINQTTRERFFRGEPAAGRSLRAGGQLFTVVGVVRDVPISRTISFSEIWVPTTTARTTNYRSQLVGGFAGILLAESRARFAEIKAEYDRRLASVDLSSEPAWERVESGARTLLEQYAHSEADGAGSPSVQMLWIVLQGGLAALLFMALPALNLINLNLSRILERSSEIGVRKAFGASSRTLVGQFLVESVLLTCLGGLLGLALAEVVMAVLNEVDLVPYVNVHVNYRVFLGGLLLSVIFGVFSGAYPAWRMSRMHPVEAIRGRL